MAAKANHALSRQALRTSGILVLAAMLGACSSFGSSGPGAGRVMKAGKDAAANLGQARVSVIELTAETAGRAAAFHQPQLFSELFGEGRPVGSIVNVGDVLDVSIWEAPPAVLLGSVANGGRLETELVNPSVARSTQLPEQIVSLQGTITVPFVGALKVAGKAPREIEQEIVSRLTGKAHEPQAVVRIARNTTADATVVGEVANSTRMPLTPKGERLLDALAVAGGTKQPIGKSTIQLSRNGKVASLPLEFVVRNPQQNIRLQTNDVVSVYYQPYSFTALGAIGTSSEVPFEGTGMTLAQALGRIGGLRDERADVRGVFVFRLEDPTVLGQSAGEGARLPDGRVPVIYRLDLSNPTGFFLAQRFQINDKDIVYVANAPAADLQKFVNMVSALTFSVVGVANSL